MSRTTLTPEQIKFAELLADPTDTRTQAELAVELGVRPETLSRWKRVKGFGEFVTALARVSAIAELGRALGALSRSAQKGNVQSARLLFEVCGVLQAQPARTLFQAELYTGYLDPDEDAEEEIKREVRKLTDAERQRIHQCMVDLEGTLITDWGLVFERVSVREDLTLALNVLASSVGDGVFVDDRALRLDLVPAR